MRGPALGNHFPRATFTLAALRGNTELELDVIEAQAGTHLAGDVAVGNPVANTDDHDGTRAEGWLLRTREL